MFVLVVAVALAGCSKAPAPQLAATSMVDTRSTYAETQKNSTSANGTALVLASASPTAKLLNPATTAVEDIDYRISPLDMLEVSVFQVPDLSKKVRVAADGRITLALIGDVMAAGKSTHQLETEIAAELGEKYLQSPEVSVFISDAASQRVTVEGAVAQPGIYPTVGGATLMQVIALSGGMTDTADSKAVLVFRNVGGKRQGAIFDYKAIRAGTVDDPVILAGDVVAVDQSGMKAAMKGLRETIGVFNLFTPLAGFI